MKYLQLTVSRYLGTEEVDGKLKNRHVTFLYFGKQNTNVEVIEEALEDVPGPSTLSNPRAVMLGVNKDIPAVAYDLHNPQLRRARAEIMQKHGEEVAKQNFVEWLPHISHITMEEVKERNLENIEVSGVEANDGTWKYDLLSLK